MSGTLCRGNTVQRYLQFPFNSPSISLPFLCAWHNRPVLGGLARPLKKTRCFIFDFVLINHLMMTRSTPGIAGGKSQQFTISKIDTIFRFFQPQPPLSKFVDRFWLYEGYEPQPKAERIRGSENGRSMVSGHAPAPKNAATAMQIEMRGIQAMVADLSKPVSARHLKMRKQGGSEISYIEWHMAAQYLDHFAPGLELALSQSFRWETSSRSTADSL